jgi:hypothetical protein
MNDKSTAAQSKQRFDVFVVDNWTGADGVEQASWMRVGVAFPNKDGKGFNLELKAFPVSGKLVIREYEPRPKE